MTTRIFLTVSLVAGLLAAAVSLAQRIDQMEKFDEYHVYYNLVNSRFLAPEVADRYDLPREEGVAVLTISVRAPAEDGGMTDQPAKVSGVMTDLVEARSLDFEEFRDPQAIYYIAEVPTEDRAKVDFSIEVQPTDSAEAYELEFSHREYPRDPGIR
jgi:hypothetical protein